MKENTDVKIADLSTIAVLYMLAAIIAISGILSAIQYLIICHALT